MTHAYKFACSSFTLLGWGGMGGNHHFKSSCNSSPGPGGWVKEMLMSWVPAFLSWLFLSFQRCETCFQDSDSSFSSPHLKCYAYRQLIRLLQAHSATAAYTLLEPVVLKSYGCWEHRLLSLHLPPVLVIVYSPFWQGQQFLNADERLCYCGAKQRKASLSHFVYLT